MTQNIKEKEYQKKYREKNKEKLKEEHRKHYGENKEIYAEKSKKWAKENPEKMNLARAKYKKNNLEKVKAKDKARWNVKIPKGQLCQCCLLKFAEERHHEDYSKPLEVIFLCISCHKSIHTLKRRWKEEVGKVFKDYRKDMKVLEGNTELTFEEHMDNIKQKLGIK